MLAKYRHSDATGLTTAILMYITLTNNYMVGTYSGTTCLSEYIQETCYDKG